MPTANEEGEVINKCQKMTRASAQRRRSRRALC